jgi:HlyD family secretion protein
MQRNRFVANGPLVRRLFTILFLLALGGAGGAWYLLTHKPAETVWQGYAEADYLKIGPVLEGRLTRVSVNRGDEVGVGTVLFTQDEIDDVAARDQAARQLAQAKEQLTNLVSGGKVTEIQQAQGNLADARATLVRAEADLGRDEKLLTNGFATVQNVDQRRADYLSAKAKVAVNEAALEQMLRPMGRDGEISAQRATVAAAQSALGMAEWRLAQRRVTAPAAGRIADVIAFPGETMDANTPVVSLLPPQNIFVRFFVPESAVGALHRGDPVTLHCDGCKPGLTGAISFISPTAEYTPPLIYSESNNDKLVFMVEARPKPEEAALFSPGQQVEVRPLKRGSQ